MPYDFSLCQLCQISSRSLRISWLPLHSLSGNLSNFSGLPSIPTSPKEGCIWFPVLSYSFSHTLQGTRWLLWTACVVLPSVSTFMVLSSSQAGFLTVIHLLQAPCFARYLGRNSQKGLWPSLGGFLARFCMITLLSRSWLMPGLFVVTGWSASFSAFGLVEGTCVYPSVHYRMCFSLFPGVVMQFSFFSLFLSSLWYLLHVQGCMMPHRGPCC